MKWPPDQELDNTTTYQADELAAVARQARKQSQLTEHEVGDVLGVSAECIRKAETHAGTEWAALQRQIIEWCTGIRVETEVRYFIERG